MASAAGGTNSVVPIAIRHLRSFRFIIRYLVLRVRTFQCKCRLCSLTVSLVYLVASILHPSDSLLWLGALL